MLDERYLFVYQNLSLGGVESVILSRMIALEERGVQSRALFLKDAGGIEIFTGYTDQVLVENNPGKVSQFLLDYHPDWVVSFDTPSIIPVASQTLPEATRVYEIHTTLEKNLSPLRDPQLLSYLHGLVTPSEVQRKKVLDFVRINLSIQVIPNSVLPAFFVDQMSSVKPKKQLVTWVGRLEAHKNWQQFLQIAARCNRVVDGCEFWLVGGARSTPGQHQELWNFIKQEQLAARFRWFPQIPYNQMPSVLQMTAASGGCFVSTSRGESFGLAVLEAMAAGCPIVTTRVGGLLNLVEEGKNGFGFDHNDSVGASQKVIQILRDSELQQKMGKHSRVLAKNYSAEASTDIFLKVMHGFKNSSPVMRQPC